MKGIGFQDLVGCLREVLAGLPDRRQGKNRSYPMEDFGLSAFAVFFTQSPSFLAHQPFCRRVLLYDFHFLFTCKPDAHKTPLKVNGCELSVSDSKGEISWLLATLNILAFLFHTVLEFTDESYRLIRATLPTR